MKYYLVSYTYTNDTGARGLGRFFTKYNKPLNFKKMERELQDINKDTSKYVVLSFQRITKKEYEANQSTY